MIDRGNLHVIMWSGGKDSCLALWRARKYSKRRPNRDRAGEETDIAGTCAALISTVVGGDRRVYVEPKGTRPKGLVPDTPAVMKSIATWLVPKGGARSKEDALMIYVEPDRQHETTVSGSDR